MPASSRRVLPWILIPAAVLLAIWWGLRHAQASVPAVRTQEHTGAVDPAAIALARMAADETPVATASRAASVPAEAASDSLASCGGDQAAVYAAPATQDGMTIASMVQIKPAGQGWVDATHRLDARMRASNDPYVQAVAVALNVGDVLTPAGRIDALAQIAANASDPRIYSLGYRSCLNAPEIPGSCRILSARQWANRDPGNAAPWIYVLNQAVAAGDTSAQREALSNMASSARFALDFYGPAGAVSDLVPAEEGDLAASWALVFQAFSGGQATMPPMMDLTNACRNKAGGDLDLAQQCDRIGDVMFELSDTMLPHLIGARLHQMATGDSSRLDQAHAERDKVSPHFLPPPGLSGCGTLRYMTKRFSRMAQIGELEYGREMMRAATPH